MKTSLALRLFDLIVQLYPRKFKDRFAPEMREMIEQETAAHDGRLPLSYVVRLGWDLLVRITPAYRQEKQELSIALVDGGGVSWKEVVREGTKASLSSFFHMASLIVGALIMGALLAFPVEGWNVSLWLIATAFLLAGACSCHRASIKSKETNVKEIMSASFRQGALLFSFLSLVLIVSLAVLNSLSAVKDPLNTWVNHPYIPALGSFVTWLVTSSMATMTSALLFIAQAPDGSSLKKQAMVRWGSAALMMVVWLALIFEEFPAVNSFARSVALAAFVFVSACFTWKLWGYKEKKLMESHGMMALFSLMLFAPLPLVLGFMGAALGVQSASTQSQLQASGVGVASPTFLDQQIALTQASQEFIKDSNAHVFWAKLDGVEQQAQYSRTHTPWMRMMSQSAFPHTGMIAQNWCLMVAASGNGDRVSACVSMKGGQQWIDNYAQAEKSLSDAGIDFK